MKFKVYRTNDDYKASRQYKTLSREEIIAEMNSGTILPSATLEEDSIFSSRLLKAAGLDGAPTGTSMAAPPISLPAVALSVSFSRHSGWPNFFYFLAILNVISGVIIALSGSPTFGIIAGASSAIACLFFAFVSQLLVDIRWILSRK